MSISFSATQPAASVPTRQPGQSGLPAASRPPQAPQAPMATSPTPQQQTAWTLQLQGMVSQLGAQATVGMDGNVHLNGPLIDTLVNYREATPPALYNTLANTYNLMTLVEGLYTAQRLAEAGVSNVGMLYGATQRLHQHPHPLVQIYLAGFYRALNAPHTLGPLLSMLVKNAVLPGPPIPSAFDPQEEIGGAILDLIARKSATETLRLLRPR